MTYRLRAFDFSMKIAELGQVPVLESLVTRDSGNKVVAQFQSTVDRGDGRVVVDERNRMGLTPLVLMKVKCQRHSKKE